jgi:hypothetical protein
MEGISMSFVTISRTGDEHIHVWIAEYPGHSLDKIRGDISIVKEFLVSITFFRHAPGSPNEKPTSQMALY